MITLQEQLVHLGRLGLNNADVTDLKERQKNIQELKMSGNWNPDIAKRLDSMVLEITDPAAIKKAWRARCMEFHPDKFDEKAYQEYIDTLKRCAENVEEPPIEPVLGMEDMVEKFKEYTHSYKMLTDPSYANKFAKAGGASGQEGLDATFNVAVDFEQAFFGDSVTITFNPLHIDDSGKPVKIDKEKDIHLDAEVIKIRVKEGTKAGDRITVPKKGLCRRERRGDMFIAMQVTPHSRFRMEGVDIVDTLEIPLDLMLTGGVVSVPTMWGVEEVRVPAGSRPEDKLCVKKKGVSKVGDHVVIVKPQYPEKEELKERDIWKKLGINWTAEQEKDDKEAEQDQQFQDLFQSLGGFTFANSTSSSSNWGV